MYLPKDFEEQNQEVLLDLIRDNPLSTLVATTDNGVTANHLPLLLAKKSGSRLVLQGHIARANALWKDTTDKTVLAIFQASQGYISPNWYPAKKEHGKVVPTWNYQVVHAQGEITFIQDNDWKLEFLNALTKQLEASQPVPWAVDDAPPDYIQRMLRAIVGFEIDVTQLIGKFKVSQNKSTEDRQGVRAGLAEMGNVNAKGLSGFPNTE